MKLLFICTHNRCRSILSEAITNNFKNNSLIAASAGSSPQGEVHPLTIKYLKEKGISTNELTSQSWHEFEDFKPDVVLTMCDNAAKEVCPVWFKNSLQINWALKDPSKAPTTSEKNIDNEQHQKEAFHRTIDIIERRIEAVIKLQEKNLPQAKLKEEFIAIANQIQ